MSESAEKPGTKALGIGVGLLVIGLLLLFLLSGTELSSTCTTPLIIVALGGVIAMIAGLWQRISARNRG